ncbi:MAG: HDIG domain-containing protein [Candidatus Tectimicrobiota bacterium]|nr:MAG: HDIG domain-containing protein [Candidatus Tectomicrobia bacterium]
MHELATFPFVRALQARGARIYLVGGTVRDALLGLARKDLDLLVTGVPQRQLMRLLRPYGRVQLTGRAFGVIKFLPQGWEGPPIDIALPRTEVSTGVGHRDFVVTFDHTLPVETDLQRRDFTINAMALELPSGRLIDPFGGQQDLARRLLRQVSPRAFPEDPLRILRGVQLAARFALQVDPETQQAMQACAALITTVAPERIAEELRKLFQAPQPSRGFALMQEVGLLGHILPELARLAELPEATGASSLFARTLRRLDAVQGSPLLEHRGELDLLLAALFYDSGRAEAPPAAPAAEVAARSARLARQRLEALKMTTIGVQPKRVEALIAASAFDPVALASDAALRHFASRLGAEMALRVLELRLADSLGNGPPEAQTPFLHLRQRLHAQLARQVPLGLPQLAVNGHDLQRLGIPPGPRLGRILNALLHHVLDNPACNTRDHLLALADEIARGGASAPACCPPS